MCTKAMEWQRTLGALQALREWCRDLALQTRMIATTLVATCCGETLPSISRYTVVSLFECAPTICWVGAVES